MNDKHDAICHAVDLAFDEQVAFLREMVRVPTDTPPGDNAPHAIRTAELLDAMGMRAERHPVPAQQVQAGGLKSLTNLLVRHRFGEGPVIALNAHGDVVPPGGGWTHSPYGGEIVDGRMYGRGVAVSKSDFATYAFALRALRETGLPLAGTVELHFTYDEEFGGELGPGWLLARGLSRPDLAIGAGFSYGIVTAHNGCLQLEVTVRGVAAHAAMPETGVDALAGAIAIRLDRRMIPEEDPVEVEAALRRLIEAAVPAACRVEIRRLLLARALRPLPGHERLAGALAAHAARIFGEPVAATGTPLYTDARLYGEAGVPAVLYGAGPRSLLEANAKRADENLLLEDLRRATQVVACALHDLLSTQADCEDDLR